MQCSVKYNSEIDIIELFVEGKFTFNDAKSILNDAKNLFQECNCYKFLTDYRKAVLNVNTFELYNFAELISETMSRANIPSHKIKRAVVSGPELADYQFLETLSVNRGQRIRVFNNTSEAIKWLHDDSNNS